MHNGAIREFPLVKRELAFAVDPSLYAEIEGSTDSELFFYLALTFGLEDDPPLAVERAVGLIEETGRRHGVEHPIQMTRRDDRRRQHLGVPLLERGQLAVALLQHGACDTLRHQYPDNPVLHELSDESRLVVSEPLGDLAGAWNEVPESSWGVVQAGPGRASPVRAAPARIVDRGLHQGKTAATGRSRRLLRQMSWGLAFRIRQTLKGSLWVLPLVGGLAGLVLSNASVWLEDARSSRPAGTTRRRPR